MIFALELSFRSKDTTFGPTSGSKGASKRRLEAINVLNFLFQSQASCHPHPLLLWGYTFLYFMSSGGIEVDIGPPLFVRNDSR